MEELKSEIKNLAREYLEEVIKLRRHLHRHPELSTKEFKTSEFIQDFLQKEGIPFKAGLAGTGVVAEIQGSGSGKTIALRADIDALPILEKNEVSYASGNPGIMHACGHDVHTACLLGAAKILNNLKDRLNGKVMLVFQPSEEKYPGGAKMLIDEGVFNPPPDAIFGQHVFPELQASKIGVKSGKYMASTDEVFITVKGRGGHGAIPDQNIDPVLIAAHIIIALQQIVSRNAKPNMPTVLSFGRVIADGHTNIIPNEVKIEGIIRTFDESWREKIKSKIKKIATSMAESMGGSCDIFIDKGYPYLENDPEKARLVKNLAIEYIGEENVVDLEQRMTAEDFAYYTQLMPACFYRLGTRNEAKGIISNLHSDTFNVDETSIETGMGFFAWIAVNELQ